MLLVADALGLEHRQHSTSVEAMLEQDPEGPTEDFTFDATEIIKEVKELKPGFEGRIQELRVAEIKSVHAHTMVMQQLGDEKKIAEKTLTDAESKKAAASEKIAKGQGDLTLTNGMLSDDRTYLSELTEVCNTKSKAWDQRSRARTGELQA